MYADEIPRLWITHRNILAFRSEISFNHAIFVTITTFAVFAALVLTAMQVGLATTHLQENDRFQRTSYILPCLGFEHFCDYA